MQEKLDRIKILRWKMERAVTTKIHWYRAFSPAKRKILILSLDNRIAQSQIFPFRYFSSEISTIWDAEIREIPLEYYKKHHAKCPGGADFVLVQPWFDIARNQLKRLLVEIRNLNPKSRIIFLDCFAPTDLRLASSVNDHIDLYLSKHLLRNRNDYFKSTRGDTTVTDYYNRHYNLKAPEVFFDIPEGFLDKLVVGPSFFTSPKLLPYFLKYDKKIGRKKMYDIHGRLGFNGTPWYRAMRLDAITKMEAMKDLSILSTIGVSHLKYIHELQQSKICFSPFGYGEVCWRDYEAVMCGSLLVKPDMSSVETCPNIFQPYITYVPIKWNFSDFEEKVRYYLEHDDEREKITDRAYAILHEYYQKGQFIKQHKPIFAY